jgi:hypothetical protein
MQNAEVRGRTGSAGGRNTTLILWNTYGTPMEYLWNSYGVPMEYLWSNTPPTRHQHASSGLSVAGGGQLPLVKREFLCDTRLWRF